MSEHYHQLSAFVAVKGHMGYFICAYSVYDNGDLKKKQYSIIPGITEHRALLMSAWSAVHYCKQNIPEGYVEVYFEDRQVADELTAVWYGKSQARDFADADRIESVIDDCVHVGGTSFSVLLSTPDYVKRMNDLKELLK